MASNEIILMTVTFGRRSFAESVLLLTAVFRPQPDVNSNKIPEAERLPAPTVDEVGVVRNSNEIPGLRGGAEPGEEHPSNVLMSHAGDDSIFNKTEVLAGQWTLFAFCFPSSFKSLTPPPPRSPPALIAGGAVGLMFAVLLILLLIYRMKKKDEGSYDLGKKPIYKKAPTTEIYA